MTKKETLIDGLVEEFYENGQLKSRDNYKDGKLNGLWEYYYEDGQLSIRGNYKNGKEDGLWEWFHKTGGKSTENYKNGKLDGLSELFDENGQIEERENYKDGKLHGLYESFHKSGQLKSRDNYKNGKLNGLYNQFYENGQLEEKGNYKNDELDGLLEWFYENGQLKVRQHHKNGKEDGLWEYFDEDGNLTNTEEYKNERRRISRVTIKPEEFDNEVINDIQICSFMCGIGKGDLHEKQGEYLFKGLVNDAILLILLEDAFNDYAKNKDLSSALKKVGISKIKDGWLSQDLGGKMLTIETGIGNWLADVIDGYTPQHISEFNEKKQKVKSYEQHCELEESVAKKIKTKFLQKICLLCMRSLGEQDSISSGEIISIENMCKIWNIQHSEVIEWYQSVYEIIKIGYGGLLPPLNVAPFMPNFFDVGDLKTVFYNLNKSEKNKINKLCKHTVDNEMDFAEGIRYIEDNSSKEINKTLLIGVHEKDPNGIRFIFSKDGELI